MKALLAQLNYTIGDFHGNTKKILDAIEYGRSKGADLVLFSEMAITGYPPDDLLYHRDFIEAANSSLEKIVSASLNVLVIVGTVRSNVRFGEKNLFNSAAVIHNGKLLGYQDKTLLPTYDVFDERRYFEPAEQSKIWHIDHRKIGVTICEDIWEHGQALFYTRYKRDPVKELEKHSPDLVVNLSSSPWSYKKIKNRIKVCSKTVASLKCNFLFCNQVGANDSLIFDGQSLFLGPKGEILAIGKAFEEDLLLVDMEQRDQPINFHRENEKDLYDALVLGIRDYFRKQGFTKACIGLSGGIDSALVACLAVQALGKENVLSVGMPSRYSSEGSISDSKKLCENLGVRFEMIPIEEPFNAYLNLLGPVFGNAPTDVTEENLQARIRGAILMAISNKRGYIVLSTANKSELSMGYSTLYGDMCGGLAAINDLTKQQVYAVSKWINKDKEIIPQNILAKPPSAELRPNQKDTDSLPEYEIVDHVLQGYVEEHLSEEQIARKHGYPLELVQELVRKIHLSEYKRRQGAPGLRVSEKSFSIGRRFPIVQKWS